MVELLRGEKLIYFKDAFKNAPTVEERNAALKAQLAAITAAQAAKEAGEYIDKCIEKMRCPNTKCSSMRMKSAYIEKNEAGANIRECIGFFCIKCKSFFRL